MSIPIATITGMCREIIRAYTFHVRDRVKEGKKEYIDTGIDEDIHKYKEVFLEILAYSLGVKERKPNRVMKECKVVITEVLSNKEYVSILTKYKFMVYTTCEVMFEIVMEELGYCEDK